MLSAFPIGAAVFRVLAGLRPAPWADEGHPRAALVGGLFLAVFIYVLITMGRRPKRALRHGAITTTIALAAFWSFLTDVRLDDTGDWIALACYLGLTAGLLWLVWTFPRDLRVDGNR